MHVTSEFWVVRVLRGASGPFGCHLKLELCHFAPKRPGTIHKQDTWVLWNLWELAKFSCRSYSCLVAGVFKQTLPAILDLNSIVFSGVHPRIYSPDSSTTFEQLEPVRNLALRGEQKINPGPASPATHSSPLEVMVFTDVAIARTEHLYLPAKYWF